MYNTVMRYGMADRASYVATRTSGETTRPSGTASAGVEPVPERTEAEADNDDAMSEVIELVQEVKQHGGRQLLSYVRNLLG